MFLLFLLNFVRSSPIVLVQSLYQNQFLSTDTDTTKWQSISGVQSIIQEESKSILGGFDQHAQLFRIVAIPPHYMIRIEATLWIYNKWNNTQLACYIDSRKVAAQSTFSLLNTTFKQKYSFNVINYHNNPSMLVRFKTSKSDQSLDLSWGVRDVIISYYPCPTGCDQCQKGDTQEQCLKWELKYNHFSQLSLRTFINDGWKIVGGDTSLKYSTCVNIPMFGFIDQGQKLMRSFFLDSHYRIKIKFLLFKIDNWGKANALLYIDGLLLWQQQFDDDDSVTYSNLCSITDELDDFIRVDQEIAHTNQFIEMYFTTQIMNEGFPRFGIRDFQIFIIPCQSGCSSCTNSDCLSTQNVITINQLDTIQYLVDQSFSGTEGWIMDKTTDAGLITECTIGGAGKTIVGGYNMLGRDSSVQKTYLLPPPQKNFTQNCTLCSGFLGHCCQFYQ